MGFRTQYWDLDLLRASLGTLSEDTLSEHWPDGARENRGQRIGLTGDTSPHWLKNSLNSVQQQDKTETLV